MFKTKKSSVGNPVGRTAYMTYAMYTPPQGLATSDQEATNEPPHKHYYII
jgi:hypothetical protein